MTHTRVSEGRAVCHSAHKVTLTMNKLRKVIVSWGAGRGRQGWGEEAWPYQQSPLSKNQWVLDISRSLFLYTIMGHISLALSSHLATPATTTAFLTLPPHRFSLHANDVLCVTAARAQIQVHVITSARPPHTCTLLPWRSEVLLMIIFQLFSLALSTQVHHSIDWFSFNMTENESLCDYFPISNMHCTRVHASTHLCRQLYPLFPYTIWNDRQTRE